MTKTLRVLGRSGVGFWPRGGLNGYFMGFFFNLVASDGLNLTSNTIQSLLIIFVSWMHIVQNMWSVPPWRHERWTSVRGEYCLKKEYSRKRLRGEVSTVATLHPSWRDQDCLLSFRLNGFILY